MDNVDKATRSRIMSAIHSRGTKPEIIFEKTIGIPYNANNREYCNADYTFPSSRVAVFIDGEFWHGRLYKPKPDTPQKWIDKITGNVARDLRNRRALRAMGWIVLEFWESTMYNRSWMACELVRRIVSSRQGISNGEEFFTFEELGA